MKVLYFDFYNVKVKVEGDEIILQQIKQDFQFFISSSQYKNFDIKLKTYISKPPIEKIPPAIKVSMYHPNFFIYKDRQIKYIDYHQMALSIYNTQKEEAEIYSPDPELLHELSYLFILSRVGEHLDRKGIHRIHALGITKDNKAAIFLIPQSAGKTTLAIEILKNFNEFKILSDDIVLITRNKALPFPLRLGLVEKDKSKIQHIPDNFLSKFHRRNLPSKILIKLDYYKNKISNSAIPKVIFVCLHENSSMPRIIKINKLKVFQKLITSCIIGYGLPQVLEYFLTADLMDLIRKFNIIISRTFLSIYLLMRCKTYCFILSKDTKNNYKLLVDTLYKIL